MIAVTFALPVESSELLRRLSDQSGTDRNGIQTIRGTIDGREVEVLHTGVGEKICRKRLVRFLDNERFETLISTGFAGALTDELRVGDLLLARNFLTVKLNKAVSPFSNLPIRVADLLTVPALIDSSEERNETARASGAAAIDMETEFIARICAEHRVPLLSLRVITDAPREPFPVPADVLFDIENQRIPLPALTRFILSHANRIPRLIQFTRRIAQARKILASALLTTINEL